MSEMKPYRITTDEGGVECSIFCSWDQEYKISLLVGGEVTFLSAGDANRLAHELLIRAKRIKISRG